MSEQKIPPEASNAMRAAEAHLARQNEGDTYCCGISYGETRALLSALRAAYKENTNLLKEREQLDREACQYIQAKNDAWQETKVLRAECEKKDRLIKDHEARLRVAQEAIHPGCTCAKCETLRKATVPPCQECERLKQRVEAWIDNWPKLDKTEWDHVYAQIIVGELHKLRVILQKAGE